MAIITSVPDNAEKFPPRKDGLKRFDVQGIVYANSAAVARAVVVDSDLDAAKVVPAYK